MEIVKQACELTTQHFPQGGGSNDNRPKPLSRGRSTLPDDAVARIYKPTRSVTTSGKARAKGWRLTFERHAAPFIEPLMGYTGGGDTLTQVEISFPTLESAVRFAERQGLTYVVQPPSGEGKNSRSQRSSRTSADKDRSHAFSDATLNRLGLSDLQDSYRQSLGSAANRNGLAGPSGWTAPMSVVWDPSLRLEAKRSILMNWAWTEHLIDQATNEGMPENHRPSRLDEVERALLALEHEVASDQDDAGTRNAA